MADPAEIARLNAAIDGLSANMAALKSWTIDFDQQRRGWGYPSGIEQRVADVFDLSVRIHASFAVAMEQTHMALEAIRAHLQGETP